MSGKHDKIAASCIRRFSLALLAGGIIITGCSDWQLAGSISETTNGGVVGAVVNKAGAPASLTPVKLFPADYDPVKNSAAVRVDTTDILGNYNFANVPPGDYTVLAGLSGNNFMAFVAKVHIDNDTVTAPAAILLKLGAIKVTLPVGVDEAAGYVYVPGSNIISFLNGNSGFVVMDLVPAAMIPDVAYSETYSLVKKDIRHDVRVFSGDTTIIENPEWGYARALYFNTTPSGANTAENVYGFPVLVRLTSRNFDFSKAQTDSRDIRFTKPDNTFLSYEIERWDAATQRAEIWVKIDTVRGNDSTQSIMMYWGNPAAADSSSGTAVFDTADGFQGAWHLGDVSGDSIRDATLNRYYGVSPASARPLIAEGVIGTCRTFDGIEDFITMPNTAAGKLDFPQDGKYSVSAWVMPDTFTNLQQTLVSKGKYQYFLWIDTTSWQFWEFQNRAGWETSAQQATLKQWVLLTGVRDGVTHHLYVNGEPIDSVSLKPSTSPRNTQSNLILGRAHIATDGSFFSGGMDEVRIESTSRSSDWIRLSYMNQRTDDRLVINKK